MKIKKKSLKIKMKRWMKIKNKMKVIKETKNLPIMEVIWCISSLCTWKSMNPRTLRMPSLSKNWLKTLPNILMKHLTEVKRGYGRKVQRELITPK